MRKFSTKKTFTLVLAGSNFEVSYLDTYDYYLITGGGGGALLAANTFVLKAGQVATEGLYFRFKYQGNVVPGGGNNVVILGTILTALESKKEAWIEAIYTSGAWNVDIIPDIAVDGWIAKEMIGSDAYAVEADITTGTDQVKIVNAKSVKDWWTALKANLVQTFTQIITFTAKPVISAHSGNKYLRSSSGKAIDETDLYTVITTEVSFNTGEQGNNSIIIPYAFDIITIRTVVKEALAATDAGTITFDIDGIAVTTGVVTVPLSSAIDTVIVTTPTATKTGAANSIIKPVTAKATAGGKVHLQIILKRVLS